MKNKGLFFILIAILFHSQNLSAQKLTKNAEISLLTCSPGTSELYAHFGHSAIRVKDTTTNTDLVYNYGVFDFNTPNFYWKFVKGKLRYQLALQHTYNFLRIYAAEGREVKEEKLILTQKEKMDVLNYLQWNRKPENRYYLYDFLYNNCSSKIWDVVKPHLNSALEYDKSDYEVLTFREMLHQYLQNVNWARFGIDILLGIPTDINASFQEQMFLPDYLSENMSHVYRVETNDERRPILENDNVIIEKKKHNEAGILKDTFLDSPKSMAWILFFHILGFTLISGPGFKKWFDVIYFSILGLLSLLLLFMWFISDHTAVNSNLNLLWASPFALFFVLFRLKRSFNIMNVFSLLLLVSSVVLLIGWNILPQEFNPAVVPLSLIIPIRALDNIVIYRYQYTLSKKIRQAIGMGVNK